MKKFANIDFFRVSSYTIRKESWKISLDFPEALTVFFEKNQFSVAAVHNGQDAYDYALSGGYDAIILNVMMPKMNGIEVLQRLRKEGVQVPIMMLTAKGQTDDRIAGFSRSR